MELLEIKQYRLVLTSSIYFSIFIIDILYFLLYTTIKGVDYMQDIATMILNDGMAVAIVAYFLIKDWRLTEKLNETLSAVNEHLRKEDSQHDV